MTKKDAKDQPTGDEQVPDVAATSEPVMTAAPMGTLNIDKVLVREPDGAEFYMDPRTVKQFRPTASIVSYADGRPFKRSDIADMPDALDDSEGTPEGYDPQTGAVLETQPDGDQNQSPGQGQ